MRWIACGNWMMNTLVVALSHETPLHVCQEIDSNRSSATSPTRELSFIKICSKLLDANRSQGRISPLDSLHLCRNDEPLGRWSWLKVEKKDPSGTCRMVHSMCHNCGALKFSVLCAQNFTRGNIIYCSWMLCWLFSCHVLLSHRSRLEVFNKVMQSPHE